MVIHAHTASARIRQRLDGGWQVRPIPLDAPIPWDDSSADNCLFVPDCAHLQPILFPQNPYWGEHLRTVNQQAWIYRRSFSLTAPRRSRARLWFEGVDYFAEVWLNRQYLGRHEGAFAPFTLDATHTLRHDQPNELLVRVSSPWDPPQPGGTYPTDHVVRGLVKGLYEHGEGVIPPDVNPIGIWRPVWLLLDDGISLDHIRIWADMHGQVQLRFTTTNAADVIWHGTLAIAIEAENHDGPGTATSINCELSPGSGWVDCTLSVPEPRLWWPWDHGRPDLYRLIAQLRSLDGTVISSGCAVFGLRTVRLERSPKRFTYIINERPVFVRGSSYIPQLYLSQADSARLTADLARARSANLNLLRAHVHVSPPEFYHLCDREGMLVWQDFELNWIQDSSAAFEKRAIALQREMIALLGNHPCIITWSCHNEPTMVFARRHNLETRPDPALYADAQQQDPTRPVMICSGQMENDWRRAGDVHSYYGAIWTSRYTDIYRHRFRLNTEFGFEAPADPKTLQGYPEVWTRLQHLEKHISDLWAYQAALIQYQVEHLRRLRAEGCAGYIHFWLADLVPQVGCGVLDSERRPKGGYHALQRASQPLQIVLEHDGHRPRGLWVFNDTPQPFPGAVASWQAYDDHDQLVWEGAVHRDIAPNASQALIRPFGQALRPAACARLKLALHDQAGGLLAENVYLRPFQPLRRPRGYPWKFDPYLGTKVFDRPDAPSLADAQVSRLIKLIPLPLREAAAEWALRQRLPIWFVSAVARIADMLLG